MSLCLKLFFVLILKTLPVKIVPILDILHEPVGIMCLQSEDDYEGHDDHDSEEMFAHFEYMFMHMMFGSMYGLDERGQCANLMAAVWYFEGGVVLL